MPPSEGHSDLQQLPLLRFSGGRSPLALPPELTVSPTGTGVSYFESSLVQAAEAPLGSLAVTKKAPLTAHETDFLGC